MLCVLLPAGGREEGKAGGDRAVKGRRALAVVRSALPPPSAVTAGGATRAARPGASCSLAGVRPGRAGGSSRRRTCPGRSVGTAEVSGPSPPPSGIQRPRGLCPLVMSSSTETRAVEGGGLTATSDGTVPVVTSSLPETRVAGEWGPSVAPSATSRGRRAAVVKVRSGALPSKPLPGAACTSDRRSARPGWQGSNGGAGIRSLADVVAALPSRRPRGPAEVSGALPSSSTGPASDRGGIPRIRVDTPPPVAPALTLWSASGGALALTTRGSAKRTRRPGRSGSSPCGGSCGRARRSRWFRSTE